MEGAIANLVEARHPGADESVRLVEPETVPVEVDTIESLKTSVPVLAERSATLTITDDESCARVIEYGRELAEKKRQVNELLNPRIAQAHELHSGLCSDKRRLLEPLTRAEEICQSAVADYHELKERERLRLLAEERERERLAEEEGLRLEREMEKQNEEETRRAADEIVESAVTEAAEAEAVGDFAAASAILNQAAVEVEEIQQASMPMPSVAQAVSQSTFAAPTQFKGAPVKVKYKAEVVSLQKLCLAVGQGRVPVTAVEAKMSVLDSWVRTMGDSFNIDGVRRVAVKTVKFK